MPRFTITDLRRNIAGINEYLEDAGSTIRFEEQGRNGYQAVDQYSVDADGNRIGSGVDRNVCCGTSRECSEAAWTDYHTESARLHRESLAAKAEFADAAGVILSDIDEDSVDCVVIRKLYELHGLADDAGLL